LNAVSDRFFNPTSFVPGVMTASKNQTGGDADSAFELKTTTRGNVPKYRLIFRELKESIDSGQLRPGDRLQTEVELGARYDASRITVAKAVNELRRQGLVSRRAGSGTHVLAPAESKGHHFGLLIPDLGRTEIFEPICQGMMRSPLAKPHSLLWGHAMTDADQQGSEALDLCRRYIKQKVSGVFFAPLEFTGRKDEYNLQIAEEIAAANIKMVLLDRCYSPYPYRSKFDLVGIDNRTAGYIITEHLLKLGCKRPVFISRARSASTVQGRIAGFYEALRRHGISCDAVAVFEGDSADPSFVRSIIDSVRPDSFVCANDLTAGNLISVLNSLSIEVPREMRVVGVDDVKYAGLFSVPLTTQHQNCFDIGATALGVMLQRLARPNLPTRDVLLQTHTVIRESCGAKMFGEKDWAKPE
jgi:GntR family transcriptional regulator of arabinose operon